MCTYAEKSIGRAPIGVTADKDHVTASASPLDLNAHELRSQVEDQVVTLVAERNVDADPAFDGRMENRRLGDRALLIRREHTPT